MKEKLRIPLDVMDSLHNIPEIDWVKHPVYLHFKYGAVHAVSVDYGVDNSSPQE